MSENTLTFIGPIGEHHSLGKAPREGALALERLGYSAALWEPRGQFAWFDEHYRQTCEHLVSPTAGALNYALADWGSPRNRALNIPKRRIRGLCYDEFAAEGIRIPLWNQEFEFLVSPSRWGCEWAVDHGLNCRYAPLGVNTLDYYPVERDDTILRKFHRVTGGGINDDTVVFVHAGTLQQRKGTAELLAAYSRAFGSDDNVALLIQSSPAAWRDATTRNVLERRNCPTLWACDGGLSLAEQRRLYSIATMTVLPNYCEGFGLVALESLACGAPVMLPSHTGNLECQDCEAVVWLYGAIEEPHPKMPSFRWWRPNVDALVGNLRAAKAHSDTLRSMRPQAVLDAAKHPWETGVQMIADWLGLRQCSTQSPSG